MYNLLVIPKTKIGQPPPPPPSIFGSNLDIWVVEAPYELLLPIELNIFCNSVHLVIIIPI